MIKMISAMKLAKDKMDSPLSASEIQNYINRYKDIGVTHVEVATVIGHPAFQSYSKAWADAIHNAGLLVTWRCAHQSMEGLYNAPHYVGGNRKPEQFWIDEAVKAAQLLGTTVKTDDEWAIYPERTEGIFSDNTAFLAMQSPNTYTDFFIRLHEACRSVLPAGVKIGLSANNASELFSGWMPRTLSDKYGVAVIDWYSDNNPADYERGVREVHAKYGKPVYVQEGAPDRFNAPTRQQADTYFAVNKKLEAEGILYGFGSWSGWIGNPESTITDTGLTPHGESLKAWFTGSNNPTPPPPTGTTDIVLGGDPAKEPYSLEVKTTHQGVTKVEFKVDGKLYATEMNPPYSLFGDDNGTLFRKTLGNGVHQIEVAIHGASSVIEAGKFLITEGTDTPPPPPPPDPTNPDIVKATADLIAELASQQKLAQIKKVVYGTQTATTKITELKKII